MLSCLRKRGRSGQLEQEQERDLEPRQEAKRLRPAPSRKRGRVERGRERERGTKSQRTDIVVQPNAASRYGISYDSAASARGRTKRTRHVAEPESSDSKRAKTTRYASPAPSCAATQVAPLQHLARTECKDIKSASWNLDDDDDSFSGSSTGRIANVIVQTGMGLLHQCWPSSLVRWATNLVYDGNPFDKCSPMHSAWKFLFDLNVGL